MIKQAWNYKSLVAEGSSNSSGGGNDGAFTYKSRKVVWKIDEITEVNEYFLTMIQSLPFYSAGAYDSYDQVLDKAYGTIASGTIVTVAVNAFNGKIISLYLEECEGNFRVKLPFLPTEIETNGSFIDLVIKATLAQNPELTIPSHEEIISALAQKGIVQYSYEDYMNLRVNQSYGCLTLKN